MNKEYKFEALFNKQNTCPLCHVSSENSINRFAVNQIGWDVNLIECLQCGLVYKRHIPSDELINIIYSDNYVHYANNEIINSQPSSRLMRLGEKKGRLLDYGCGAGSFVKEARINGWEAYGCDPYLPDFLKENSITKNYYKYNAINNEIFKIGKFDIITMWAVVEHLTETQKTFKNLANMLNTNGSIVFNSPYGNSILARKNGTDWAMAILVEHLQFHTRKSVHYLAELCGLKIESIRICGSPYPFGTTNSMNQGVPSRLLGNGPESQSSAPLESNRNASFAKYMKNWIHDHIDVKRGNVAIVNGFRKLIDTLQIGDHIEVRLRKL
jgi:SAM-dependent methyltransferase